MAVRHRCLLAAATAALLTLAPPAPPAHAAVGAAAVQSLNVVSYIGPKDTPWNMWANWEPAAIDSDFAAIAALNASAVRLFVDPQEFGFPAPSAAMLNELSQAVQMAAAHNLRVYLNLFDRFLNFGAVTGSISWAAAVMQPYAGDPRVPAVEVYNEAKPLVPTQVAWLKVIIPQVQKDSGGTPVGVSVCGCSSTATLSDMHDELTGTQPDFYSFHYYSGDLSQQDAETVFASAKSIVAPLPLIIGETGMSTGPSATGGSDPTLEQQQAQWFHAVEGAAVAEGLGTAGVWTLEDFTAVNPSPQQQFFGPVRTDGTQKPAAAVVAAAF